MARACAASILLHLLIALGLVGWTMHPRDPKPIARPSPLTIVTLGAPSPRATAAPSPSPAVPAEAGPSPATARQAPKPARRAQPLFGARATTTTDPARNTAPQTPSTSEVFAAAATPDADTDVPPPTPYLRRLSRLISREQIYPRSAWLQRQEGQAIVQVRLHRGGAIRSVRLLHSSGVTALDNEALDVIRRLGTFPPLPSDYLPRQMEFVIDQPIGFSGYARR